MPFELRIALRYLLSSRLQTILILGGVAVGILAYTFMAALINGLAVRIVDDVIGTIAHVRLEPLEATPQPVPGAVRSLAVVLPSADRRAKITAWRPLVDALRREPGIIAVAPQAVGGGSARRGERLVAIRIVGSLPGPDSSIADIGDSLVAGSLASGTDDAVIGVRLAEELGVRLGQRLRVASDRGRERTLTIRGIFDIGNAGLDGGVVFVGLATAQSLLELEGAVSRIELELTDYNDAPRFARLLSARTGLEATDWISENRRIQEGLRAQGTTGSLIKVFSLMTIVIGVASVLLLAAVRRRAEIGILRSFGVSTAAISRIFLLQGSLIGLLGSLLGSAGGWAFCTTIVLATRRGDGSPALPVDPALGEYGTAILLATVASTLAAIFPARAAAQTDPYEVIHQ
jgi:lipoprotein-releasing system permease protein